MWRKIRNTWSLSLNLFLKCSNYLKQDKGELEKVHDSFIKAKETYDKLGLQNTLEYGTLLGNFAELYEKQGNKTKSSEYYRKACEAYVKAGYNGDLLDKARQNAERLGK